MLQAIFRFEYISRFVLFVQRKLFIIFGLRIICHQISCFKYEKAICPTIYQLI